MFWIFSISYCTIFIFCFNIFATCFSLTLQLAQNPESLYIDNDIDWDDLADAEDKFKTLRKKDKLYIKELISSARFWKKNTLLVIAGVVNSKKYLSELQNIILK